MAMETSPLGLAVMCASKKYIPFIYAGMITSTMFTKNGLAIPLFLT